MPGPHARDLDPRVGRGRFGPWSAWRPLGCGADGIIGHRVLAGAANYDLDKAEPQPPRSNEMPRPTSAALSSPLTQFEQGQAIARTPCRPYEKGRRAHGRIESTARRARRWLVWA